MSAILANLEQLLKDTMGLDAASIGSFSVERALHERRAQCGLDDTQAYLDHVRRAPAELQALIEAVVVRETWFFREREAFSALVRVVRDEWLLKRPYDVFHILSMPCSTGEEPYSIAMALLDAGVPASRFRIDAIDISHLALDDAKRATYGRNSFRGADLAFRDRHFAQTEKGYRLSTEVAQQVRFAQNNILTGDFSRAAGVYDVVFCRNVLIYFDRVMQDRAIAVLSRLLTRTGWLFVGASETGLPASHGFASVKIPMAFGFQKAGLASDKKNFEPKSKPVRVAAAVAQPRAMPISPTVVLAPPPPTGVTKVTACAAPALERAAKLADQGKLDQAALLCNEHVKAHGPSAQAFYLQGLIQDAHGDLTAAISFYRKVLYLDPLHTETLIHLAYAFERQGDRDGARLLRARFDRMNTKRDAK